MTNTNRIPTGNTQADVDEAVMTTRIAMDLALELIRDRFSGNVCGTISDSLKAAAPYAQMIELRLWELRQQQQQ